MQINRRDFLSLAMAGASPALQSSGASPRPPNIIFILADDLGYGDIACQNPSSKIATPHLDRLAAEGMRFTDAHSPSAVCTPTRYGVLTGRYCWRSRLKRGVLGGDSPNLIEEGRPTVASVLKSRGYYTAGIGKWHLGLGAGEKTDFSKPLRPGPVDHGFDYYFGIPASLDMAPYVYIENDRVVEAATSETPGKKESGVFWRGGPKAPHFEFDEVLPKLTGQATRFLAGRAARPSQPFFLYFPLTAPHTPWVPARQFIGRSKVGLYGDFVMQVDAVAGEVSAALKRHGLESNTLLIVTSDNGPETFAYERVREFGHYSMGAWRGVKRDTWEGGHRVPFLARWPGRIPPNSTSGETVCLTDLMATAAAVSGARMPDNGGEDSYNILPAMLGQKLRGPIREATVLHSARGEFAIRQREWVFIDAPSGQNSREPEWFRQQRGYQPHTFPGELYNLKEDPAQSRNLYGDHPEMAAKLKELLERYKRGGRSVRNG